MIRLIMILACGAAVFALSPASPAGESERAASERTVVRSQADMPAYSYTLAKKPSELLEDDESFDRFATQVRGDLEALLAGYDIQDAATLVGIHTTLRDLALLRRDADAVRSHGRSLRELQPNPGDRLFAGIWLESLLAGIAVDDEAQSNAAVRDELRRMLEVMPWEMVGSRVERLKGMAGLWTPALFFGSAQVLDDLYAKSRTLTAEQAADLVWYRTGLTRVVPSRGAVQSAVAGYIATHKVEKPEIWSAREVSLDGREGLTPVVVAVWDSGVDPTVFGNQMWVNAGEIAGNGKDDDGNGYIDDIHGLGFGGVWGTEYDGHDLGPVDVAFAQTLPEWASLIQGFQELGLGLDTAAAQAFQARVAQSPAQDIPGLWEGVIRYSNHAHGTHVAGIALAGNPAARVLNLRADYPWQTVPPPITAADVEAMAQSDRQSIAYFKAHGVRVVNMSWGWNAKELEGILAANGIGNGADERAALARRLFDTIANALREEIRDAPDILFVPAAGNSRDDASFSETVPGSIDLPNVLTAGAVDRAGDMASFTSTGPTVRVYSNGVAVESFVPGGNRIPMSGTSMAAPQVTNLAAKLFALDPSLTVAEVVQLILDGAERTEDGRRNLINPKRSVELLAQRQR